MVTGTEIALLCTLAAGMCAVLCWAALALLQNLVST